MNDAVIGSETRALVRRMEHAHFAVTDLERSIDFYRRAFGFAVRWKGRGLSGPCAHVGTDRFYLALSEAGSAGTGSFYHLGFLTDDLAAFEARMNREGIAITERADRPEGRALYIEDPDGVEFEIVQYRPGYEYA